MNKIEKLYGAAVAMRDAHEYVDSHYMHVAFREVIAALTKALGSPRYEGHDVVSLTAHNQIFTSARLWAVRTIGISDLAAGVKLIDDYIIELAGLKISENNLW